MLNCDVSNFSLSFPLAAFIFLSFRSSLNTMKWAKMYVYYVYAHKASWHTVQQTPAISRHIQVYQVGIYSFQTFKSMR